MGNINYEEGELPEPIKNLNAKEATTVLHDQHTGQHRRFLNEEIEGFHKEDDQDYRETEVFMPAQRIKFLDQSNRLLIDRPLRATQGADRRFVEISNMNTMGAGRGLVGGTMPKPANASPELRDNDYICKSNNLNKYNLNCL